MNMSLVKKFRIEIRIIAGICIISIILISMMFVVLYSISSLNKKIGSQEKQLSMYMEKFTSGTEISIKAKEFQESRLKLEYEELKNTLSSIDDSSYGQISPLDFKQKLFDVQEKLTAKAKRKNIILPEFIGFKEYNLNVPESSLSGLLMEELDITEEIINDLINSGAYAINKIELPHEKTRIEYKPARAEKAAFYSLSMNLAVEIQYADLKKFLTELFQSNKIYVIWQLDIKSKDEQAARLNVDFTLKTVEL